MAQNPQNPSPFQPVGTGPLSSQPVSQGAMSNPDAHAAIFRHPSYLIRRKLMKLIGSAFYVDDPSGAVVLYADRKALKLKDDIRLYTGEDKTVEVLRIGARAIMDFGGNFDVFDSASGQKIGTLKRQIWKSIARDQWTILDAQDREMGKIEEDSMVLALIRRFIELAAYFLPQKYSITVGNRPAGTFSQTKNPFLMKIQADFSSDTSQILDRRLGIAAGILLCAIEGKQR